MVERVAHLRNLATLCRNLAGNTIPEHAADLERLAEFYETKAAKQEALISGGFVEPKANPHPQQPLGY